MKFTPELLRRFFSFFKKELREDEVQLLLTGKGKWFPTWESKRHEKKIEKYLWIFSFIPGLVAVFFCNTTAFRSADEYSDIDLFIVSEDKQLWITRVFTTLFTHVLGIRRHGKYVAERWCLSFFASKTGAFELEKLQIEAGNDSYLAVWLATAECVFAQANFLETFQEKNNWIYAYGLTFTQNRKPQNSNCIQQFIGNGIAKIGGEKLLKILLEKRAKKKMQNLKDSSGTIISDTYLKFHDKDIRKEIQKYLNY